MVRPPATRTFRQLGDFDDAMDMNTIVKLVLALDSLALIGLAALSVHAWKSTKPSVDFTDFTGDSEKVYEDEDGIATVETQRAYSVKLTKRSILILAVIALSVITALSILETLTVTNPTLVARCWITVALWVCFRSPPCPMPG